MKRKKKANIQYLPVSGDLKARWAVQATLCGADIEPLQDLETEAASLGIDEGFRKSIQRCPAGFAVTFSVGGEDTLMFVLLKSRNGNEAHCARILGSPEDRHTTARAFTKAFTEASKDAGLCAPIFGNEMAKALSDETGLGFHRPERN